MVITNMINSFKSQSITGIWICSAIAFITVLFLIIAVNTWIYYRRLLEELKSKRDKEEENFSNTVLFKIYNEFRNSLGKGTERVNTSAIVSKNIPERVYFKEELLNYCISSAIILGLLGTFIGLTGSIQKIEEVLRNLEDVKEFTEQIKGPLSSMATAFITSISGIIASIIMNLTALGTFRGAKNRFFDEIEDYLDNYIYVKYSRNYNELLYVFTNKVESSMKYMTDKVTETFDTGVDKFVERINGMSLDLTESAKTLNTVIDKLDISVNTFNKPVYTFKESVDNFKLYYEGFDFKINEIDRIVRELVQSLEMTVSAFNNNREKMMETSTSLSESSYNLANSYGRLMSLVERIEQYFNTNDDVLKERVKDMAEAHNQLITSIDMFKKEISSVAENVSDILGESFRTETGSIANELNKQMELPINALSSVNTNMAENMMIMLKVISSLENMIEEIDNQYHPRSNGVRHR